MKKPHTRLAVVAIASLLISACAGQRTLTSGSMSDSLGRSDYQVIANQYVTASGQVKYNKNNLLDLLEAGKALHDAGRWQESNDAFQLAERKLAWKKDSIDTPAEVVNLLGTSISNDTLGTYRGKIYEGGLINYYIALNTLMLGNEADSRVEFNRLEERQDNAVRQLSSYARTVGAEIEEGMLEANETQANKSFAGVEKSAQQGLEAIPAGVSKAKIRNASGDVLAAAFRATSTAGNDKSIGRISGMLNNASASAATPDGRALAKQLRSSIGSAGGRLNNKIVVLYEDGQGPSYEEFRVDLPLFLVTDKVTYTGIALPKFQEGRRAHGAIQVNGQPVRVMTDFNQIEGLEFETAYDSIVARAVVSTIIKTAAQVAANAAIDKEVGNNLVGSLLKIGTGAVQYALTKADLRVWANLPNTISVAVIDRPADGRLRVTNAAGGELLQMTLPEGPNSLVLIRASGTAGLPAAYAQSLPAVKPEPQTLLAQAESK